MLGLAEGAWGHAARYAKERRQFGKPIAEFQAVQFALAEMATEIEAAKLMVYNAARLKDAGQPYVREAAMTKYFTSHVAERVASQMRRDFWRQWFCSRLSGREVLSRCQSGQNLRRHFEHAVGDNCETGPKRTRLTPSICLLRLRLSYERAQDVFDSTHRQSSRRLRTSRSPFSKVRRIA